MKFFNYSLLASSLVMATSGYAAVTETSYSDIADGATWQNSHGDSLLIATLEEDGIAVYNQQGKEIQRIEELEALGADVRYGIKSESGKTVDIAAVALPDESALAFFAIDASNQTPLTLLSKIKTEFKPEGVCLTKNMTTGHIAAVGFADSGDVYQYKLSFDGEKIGSIFTNEDGAVPVRHTHVGGEVSACIADDETGILYVAEQNIGIWAYGADPENVKDRVLVDVVKPLGHLSEVEDMDILYQADGQGIIIAADEGEGFTFYDRQSYEMLAQFDIEGVDEAKLVSTAGDSLWIGNTELDDPVYQTLSHAELKKISGYQVSHPISTQELKSSGAPLVKASGETEEVNKSGDAADDPAFWYNPKVPEQSLIIATNKKKGIMAYNLDGEELQLIKSGKINNVDIRQGLKTTSGKTVDLAAASNRSFNTIALYTIDGSKEPMQVLPAVGSHVHEEAPELASELNEVYGLCMYQNEQGTPYVFVNGKSGDIEQWRINLNDKDATGSLVRKLKVGTQPEGCVVDDATHTLYVGEEDHAIWSFDARENGSTKAKLFAKVDDDQLTDDIEGLTLYQSDQHNLLIASSQGNNTYAVFDLANGGKYLSNFAIIGDDSIGVDGASDTDGIQAVSYNLGTAYPNGLFIAQDWYNIDASYDGENQNFKIVDWRAIEKTFH